MQTTGSPVSSNANHCRDLTPTDNGNPFCRPSPGNPWIRPTDGTVMVYVPGDGTQDAFWIDETEVTNTQFAAFLNEQANQTEDGVTWPELNNSE